MQEAYYCGYEGYYYEFGASFPGRDILSHIYCHKLEQLNTHLEMKSIYLDHRNWGQSWNLKSFLVNASLGTNNESVTYGVRVLAIGQ